MEKIDETFSVDKERDRKISKLREELETIFNPKISVLGHGTAEDNAKNILEEGLESRSDHLPSTAIPLFVLDKSYDEQPDDYFEKFLNWEHRNYKYIVIISIQNPSENKLGITYFDNVFEELPEDKIVNVGIQGADRKYFIPPKFINGYLDVNNLKFIKNEKYDPEAEILIKRKTPFPKNLPGKFRNQVIKQIPPLPLNEEIDWEDIDWE